MKDRKGRSIDGSIARPDGSIDWLDSMPNPQTGDYGYTELLDSIGTIIMGRITYDTLMSFGVVGGGKLITTFIKETNWKFIEARSFDTGLVNLIYEKIELTRKKKYHIYQ